MWTLFDPLANQTRPNSKVGRTRKPAEPQTAPAQPSAERLWCLLEPTGPLSCKSEPPSDERT